MAVTLRSNHPATLWPGVNELFGKTVKQMKQVAPMVFDLKKSDKAYELYVEQTGVSAGVEKPENAPISYEATMQGYTSRVVNVTYAKGTMVSEEAIADNQYLKVASENSQWLARAMIQTRELVHANVLNSGFAGGPVGGDGVTLFSASHPTRSGVQSNLMAIPADLSEAALEDLLTQIKDARDSVGNRIMASATTLIVPNTLYFDANRILSSTNQSGTANNDINAMKALGMLPGGIVMFDYLTDPDAWFITTDVPEGLIYQDRMPVKLEQDNDFDTSNARMKAMARFAFGWADWRGVVASEGA